MDGPTHSPVRAGSGKWVDGNDSAGLRIDDNPSVSSRIDLVWPSESIDALGDLGWVPDGIEERLRLNTCPLRSIPYDPIDAVTSEAADPGSIASDNPRAFFCG